jgi:copper chaperone CopZ
MKRILIIALALATLNFAVNAQDKKNNKISEVKFDVTNMHGDHCKQRIEKSIPFEKGVKDVEVNLKDNTVTVKYDNTKTDAEKIKSAFKKLGYGAEDANAATTTQTDVKKASKSCCKS